LFEDQIRESRWQAIQGIEQIYESGAEVPDLFNSKTNSRPFLQRGMRKPQLVSKTICGSNPSDAGFGQWLHEEMTSVQSRCVQKLDSSELSPEDSTPSSFSLSLWV